AHAVEAGAAGGAVLGAATRLRGHGLARASVLSVGEAVLVEVVARREADRAGGAGHRGAGAGVADDVGVEVGLAIAGLAIDRVAEREGLEAVAVALAIGGAHAIVASVADAVVIAVLDLRDVAHLHVIRDRRVAVVVAGRRTRAQVAAVADAVLVGVGEVLLARQGRAQVDDVAERVAVDVRLVRVGVMGRVVAVVHHAVAVRVQRALRDRRVAARQRRLAGGGVGGHGVGRARARG